jgi:hypothetical protein
MKKIETENAVKELVFQWFKSRGGFSYAPVQNGLGVHGVPDRLGVIPITVTPAMVGKRIGLFVSVEAKRPGRRNESYRGMSKHQVLFWEGVIKAGGLSICCDGYEDLQRLEAQIAKLTGSEIK